jgi:hypothetical protein
MRVTAPSEQILSERPGLAQLLCVTLLVVASLSASLIFACATPFAAFAVFSAAILPLRPALVTIGAVWLVNQAIGFGLLGYPITVDAAMWGLAIGAAAQVATLIAVRMIHRLARMDRFATYPVALVASFAAYELCLWAITPVLGGAETFAMDVVGRLAFLNAAWLAGLAGAYEIVRLLEPRTRRHALRRTSV